VESLQSQPRWRLQSILLYSWLPFWQLAIA